MWIHPVFLLGLILVFGVVLAVLVFLPRIHIHSGVVDAEQIQKANLSAGVKYAPKTCLLDIIQRMGSDFKIKLEHEQRIRTLEISKAHDATDSSLEYTRKAIETAQQEILHAVENNKAITILVAESKFHQNVLVSFLQNAGLTRHIITPTPTPSSDDYDTQRMFYKHYSDITVELG